MLNTLTTNRHHHGFGFCKLTHMCPIKKPSFYLLTFIYGLYKGSHKQSGTMWLLGIDCKQSIKRQEKKSSECLQEVWGKTGEACRGSANQTAYTLRRQEGGFIRRIVNHCNSLYHRREDEQCGSELASCLLARFTAVTVQIVSLFNGLSMRLH